MSSSTIRGNDQYKNDSTTPRERPATAADPTDQETIISRQRRTNHRNRVFRHPHLGNFPQAFSHVELVNSAFTLLNAATDRHRRSRDASTIRTGRGVRGARRAELALRSQAWCVLRCLLTPSAGDARGLGCVSVTIPQRLPARRRSARLTSCTSTRCAVASSSGSKSAKTCLVVGATASANRALSS